MTTLETRAVVTPDRKLTVEVPPEVQPGEHRVVLIIDGGIAASEKQPPVDFPSYPAGLVEEGSRFRREDLYGPHGR